MVRSNRGERRDLRRRMIQETSAFLTWALAAQAALPQIPSRPVEDGEVEAVMAHPGARMYVTCWWDAVLSAGWWE